MLSRSRILLLIAALTAAAGVWLSRYPGSPLGRAELSATDFILQHGKRTPPNPHLHFLAIDNESIRLDKNTDLKELFGTGNDASTEAEALRLMSAHWPWPRSVYAHILNRLFAAGAKVVVFDLILPTPKEDDEVLRAALENSHGRAIVGSNFVAVEATQEGTTSATLTMPSATLISGATPRRTQVGFVNFWPDVDGVVRKARFRLDLPRLLNATPGGSGDESLSLAAQAVRQSGRAELVPGDEQERTFRLTDRPGRGFPPRSLFEIFVPEYWARNYESGAVFKDAIVVVGASGNWQHDEHQTALGLMPGPEIQLNVINALLHGSLLSPAPWPFVLLVWILAALAAARLNIRFRPPIQRLLAVTVAAAGLLGATLLLANVTNRLLPLAGPLLVLGATTLLSLIYDLISAAGEQIRLRTQLEERRRTQELLQAANEELEGRVQERTAELSSANGSLTTLVREKDVLLKEIHHRVKNNLQVISSLLNLQSGYIEDPASRELFLESRNRVRSMALIHEKLYQSHDLARVDFQDYLKTLTNGLKSTFAGKSSGTRIQLDVDAIMLGVDAAVPCGLIVNELVTNCYKHAFRGRDSGEICISMKRLGDDKLQLSVSDNGVGLPKGIDIQNTESLGMQLVTTLAEQLNGSLAVRNGCGSTFEISFADTVPIT